MKMNVILWLIVIGIRIGSENVSIKTYIYDLKDVIG